MIHTWYLSVDFQYHILAFFIMGIMSFSMKIGFIITTASIILGFVIPSMVVYRNNLPPMPLMQADREYSIQITRNIF